MKPFEQIMVDPDRSILETIQIIDAGRVQVALVVDSNRRLLGTVTDGDVRRAILKRVPLESHVQQIMNSNPMTARVGEPKEQILSRLRSRQLRQMPILDEENRVVDLEFAENLLQRSERPNWVVLMAGGEGSRLRPLTDDCPKPLLKIGNKPLLETIVENFKQYGFNRFFISVNYRAQMVKDYFGDGSSWGVAIAYLEETMSLGTAGCLGLLPSIPCDPLLVMNGDLLTNVNFQNLLDFHHEHRAVATMCVREYDFQVPYGVVQLEEHRVTGIDEKPVHRFFVNAGIYVLNPEILDLVPRGVTFDMPALLQRAIDARRETAVFPIREYWLDIGRLDDFEKANGDFAQNFQ